MNRLIRFFSQALLSLWNYLQAVEGEMLARGFTGQHDDFGLEVLCSPVSMKGVGSGRERPSDIEISTCSGQFLELHHDSIILSWSCWLCKCGGGWAVEQRQVLGS